MKKRIKGQKHEKIRKMAEMVKKILKMHIKDEMHIHQQLFSGKRTFKQHCADTIKIHKRALKKLKGLKVE
jgi:hypothetical protein